MARGGPIKIAANGPATGMAKSVGPIQNDPFPLWHRMLLVTVTRSSHASYRIRGKRWKHLRSTTCLATWYISLVVVAENYERSVDREEGAQADRPTVSNAKRPCATLN